MKTRSEKIDVSLLDTLGGRLKLTRLALGLSQAKLCGMLPDSIYPSLWNNWETNDNEPTQAAIRPFVDRFDVSLDWIYRGQGAKLRPDLWYDILELIEGGPSEPSRSNLGPRARSQRVRA